MSYPLTFQEHPIPGRKYAKVGKGAFEDKIAKMRMREDNYYKVWNDAVHYYGEMDIKTSAHGRWASNDFFVASYERYRAAELARQRESDLLQRRERLRRLLGREEQLLQLELAQQPSRQRAAACRSEAEQYRQRQQRVEAMRQQLEATRCQRELERAEEARKQLQQHWRINNAILRQVESERLSEDTRQMWAMQLQEKEQREREQREREAEEEEQRRQRLAEDERRLREEEVARQRSIQEAQEALNAQMQEISQREQAEAELRSQEHEMLQRQQQVEAAIERRQQAERRRQSRQLSLFHAQQCNARLRRRSAQVQETLQEERDFLDCLMASGDRDRLKLAEAAERAEATNLRQVLQKQLDVEAERCRAMEVLFNEEAERVWRRREVEWSREEAARRRLMDDVISSWRQQQQRRLQENREQQQREAEQRAAAAARAQQQREFVEETERLRKERQTELRGSWQRQVEEKSRRRDAEIEVEREELRLQQQQDQQEAERLRCELDRIQFSSRSLHQHRDYRPTRRQAW